MVRRRRDELDAGSRVAQPGDRLIHLVAGELPAFAGLGALRHLDLQFPGMDQIIRGDPEPGRGYLLDGAVLGVAVGERDEPLRVLTAFAGVALAADAVHGDGQGLMGFFTDRAEGHGAGCEAPDDLLRRLDVIQREGLRQGFELQESSNVRPALALIVHERRELLERLGVVGARGVLELVDRLRIPVVVFPLNAVVDLAAKVELADRRRGIGQGVPAQRLLADLADAHPVDAGGGPGEVPVYHPTVQTDGFEDLRAAVRLDGGDPHLREDLEQALVDGFDELGFGGGRIEALRQIAVPLHIHERLEHQVRIDRPGAVADQAGEVMHVAGLTGLQDQPDLGPGAFPHEMMVDRRDAEQTGNRRPLFVHASIAQDQELVPFLDGVRRLLAHAVHRRSQSVGSLGHAEKHAQGLTLKVRVGDLPDLLELGVGQDGLLDLDAAAGLRRLVHHIRLGADVRDQRHHQLFSDRIDRRVRHLRE